jgi:hypothetical protein
MFFDLSDYPHLIVRLNFIHGVTLLAGDPIKGWTVKDPGFEASTEMVNFLTRKNVLSLRVSNHFSGFSPVRP